jgi:hypothetical protein
MPKKSILEKHYIFHILSWEIITGIRGVYFTQKRDYKINSNSTQVSYIYKMSKAMRLRTVIY